MGPKVYNTAAEFGDLAQAARERTKVIHNALVLHFMVQLSLVEDARTRLATRKLGHIHHRILYFAHFTPGITVGELLSVLAVTPQNIQAPLRLLLQNGYILARSSSEDRRLKRLYCSRKGDKLLEEVGGAQRERINRACESVSPKDVESYLRVMSAILGQERRDWVRRLMRRDE